MKIDRRIESIMECLTGSEGAENCIDEGDIKDAKVELKELKQALNIHIVSQQRELLIAYHKHNTMIRNKELDEFIENYVDDYLSNL